MQSDRKVQTANAGAEVNRFGTVLTACAKRTDDLGDPRALIVSDQGTRHG